MNIVKMAVPNKIVKNHSYTCNMRIYNEDGNLVDSPPLYGICLCNRECQVQKYLEYTYTPNFGYKFIINYDMIKDELYIGYMLDGQLHIRLEEILGFD